MPTRREATARIIAAALAAVPALAIGDEPRPFALPAPLGDDRTTLAAALKMRRSTRAYSDRLLPAQTLSELLWAAYGINRPSGDRTAPYWRHVMLLDLYVAKADGVWLYEPKMHTLLPYLPVDIRAQTGQQDFVATAPVNLVYVAHGERMSGITNEERRLYACVDTAFVGQNVYLYCASVGLGTVFRASIDYPRLERALNLAGTPDTQFVTFAQTVGYPADGAKPLKGEH